MSEEGPNTRGDPHQWSHLLVESSSLDELKGPLKGSARLKFTCMSLSLRYIALGSNTGNVYIFERNTLKHLQVVFPEVEPAPVTVVALCPNDKLVAFSNTNGHVVVMEMNIEKRQKPERLRNITEHLRTTVTCLHWEQSGARLYTADITGKVTVASVPRMKTLVSPVDVIMKLESPVVQMDWSDDKLLVSTMTRCYLCSTTRQQYSQIGKKPREGEYGACFYKLNKTALPLIYCARPSSRVWEVDFEGSVLSTHQFKQLLAVPPIQILNLRDEQFPEPVQDKEFEPQGISFPRLKMLGSQYLVTVNKKKLFIFNPVKVKVILWSEFPKDIQEIHIINSDIFMFSCDGEVTKLQLFPVAQVISILIKKRNTSLAADLCCKFENVLIQAKWKKHLSLTLLQEFYARLKDEDKIVVAEKVQQVILNLKHGPEGESEGDSSESYRSRSSSTTSVKSYTSNSSNLLAAVSGSVELNSNEPENYINHKHAKLVLSTQNSLEQNGSDNVAQEGDDMDVIDGENTIFHQNSKFSLETTSAGQEKVVVKSSSMVPSVECRVDTEHVLDNNVTEMNTKIDDVDMKAVEENDTSYATASTQREVTVLNGEERKYVSQIDDDLKPVILEESLRREGNVTLTSKGKKKKKVVTVDLVNSSEKEKRKKGPRKTEKMKRSLSTGSVPSSNVKGLEMKVNAAIYEDDIFATDDIPVTEKQKKKRNKFLSAQDNSHSKTSEVDNGVDISATSKTKMNSQQTVQLSVSSSQKDLPKNLNKTAVNQQSKFSLDRSSLTDQTATFMHNDSTITDQGEVLTDQEPREQVTPASKGYMKEYEISVTDFQTVVPNKPSTRPALHQVRSDSDIRKVAVSFDLDQESTSMDSGSLGSSPNYSPLSQSWEASTSDGADTTMSQSPNKISLTSVKDSLQSKFILTKKRLLKTIKEKNILARSPLLDETSPILQFPLPRQPFPTGMKNESIIEHESESGEVDATPPVDLKDLQLSTESTHKSLQDINVVLNPDATQSILEKWVRQLNLSLQLLHTHIYKMKVEELSRDITPKTAQNEGRTADVTFYLSEQKLSDNLDTISQCSDADEEIVGYDPGKDLATDTPFSNTEVSISDKSTDAASCNVEVIDDKVSVLPDAEIAKLKVSFDGCDIIHAEDPFIMSPELHQSVSELAQTCFLCQIFGDVTKFAQPLQMLDSEIHNVKLMDHDTSEIVSSGNDLILNSEEKLSSDSNGKTSLHENSSTIKTDSDESQTSSHIFTEDKKLMCQDEMSDNDCIGSNGALADGDGYDPVTKQKQRQQISSACVFMKCHCHLLDMPKVKEKIYSYHGDVFEYWCTYVNCIQEISKGDVFVQKLSNNEIHYAEDILKIGDYSPYRTLGYVSKLFEVSPTKAVDFSIDSRHIQPLDIYCMCLYHNKPLTQHFYKYMFARVSEALSANRFGYDSGLYEHSVVRFKWLEILLSLTSHDKPLSDPDDRPLPLSHRVTWKSQSMIDHVLDSADDSQWAQLLDLCTVFRYWFGCLQMLKVLQRTQDMLTMILQLGDSTLLNSNLTYGYLPTNTDEWTFLIKKLEQQQKLQSENMSPSSEKSDQSSDVSPQSSTDFHNNQSRGSKQTEGSFDTKGSITWMEVCKLMLSHLGAVTTVTLLEECCVVPPDLFHGAVTTSYLERHKRNVTHNLLEKLDAYLWAKKPVTLMPELQYAVSLDKRTKSGHMRSTDHESQLSFIPMTSLPCVRYKEEVDVHWGVSARINRSCMCCNLPVTETVSHIEPGVLVFDCGHAYHKMCNPERQCVLCLSTTSQDPPEVV